MIQKTKLSRRPLSLASLLVIGLFRGWPLPPIRRPVRPLFRFLPVRP